VIETVSLAEFDLLRDARQDVRSLKWAQPAHREAMNLYFSIKRAHEEILRLNVEIRRLVTFMIDDYVDHYQAIQKHIICAPNIAHELALRLEYQQQVNSQIAQRLLQTSKLNGFSGSLQPGSRVGRVQSSSDDMTLPGWAEGIMGTIQVVDRHGDTVEGTDELVHQAGLIAQFMDDLGLE
jgi:hypothetical protein